MPGMRGEIQTTKRYDRGEGEWETGMNKRHKIDITDTEREEKEDKDTKPRLYARDKRQMKQMRIQNEGERYKEP